MIVQKLLERVNVLKATVPDGVPAAILKANHHYLEATLRDIFNESLITGVFPSPYKLANIGPVFKTGDRSDPTKYRPI